MKNKAALVALSIITLLIMRLPITVYADDCIENMPGVEPPLIIYEDNSPAVWVGGNFTVDPRFIESEGLNVIRGDLIVQNGELLGIGVVGAGSGIFPTMDSVMLAVGGNITTTTGSKVKIGATIPAGTISALALIGGEISEDGSVMAVYSDETEGSMNIFTKLGATATSLWSNFEAELRIESAKLAMMESTGTVTSLLDYAVFTGNEPNTSIQVFEISAEDLLNFSSWGGFKFFNIDRLENGRFAPIVINVTGETVTMYQNSVVFGNAQVNIFESLDFGNAASAILWNFVDAVELNIIGTSQVMGTIIAPYTETVNITAHTNGRLFVNGNLTRSGEGTEHHNYPWSGGGWYFECSHEPLRGIPEDPEDPIDPGDPEDPEDPSDPENLEDPIDPEDPDDPETLGDQIDPEDPGDPEPLKDPVDPEYPDDPVAREDLEDPEYPDDPVAREDPEDHEDPGTRYTAVNREIDDPVDSRVGHTAMSREIDDSIDTEDLGDLDEPGAGYTNDSIELPNTGINGTIMQWLIMICCSAALCIFSALLWQKVKTR